MLCLFAIIESVTHTRAGYIYIAISENHKVLIRKCFLHTSQQLSYMQHAFTSCSVGISSLKTCILYVYMKVHAGRIIYDHACVAI